MRLRSSLALVVAVATVLSLVIGALYGTRDGMLTWALLSGEGCLALGVVHAVLRRRTGLGSLRRQFALGAGLAMGQLLLVAVLAAQVMFVSAHDAVFALVVIVLAGVVAVRAAQLFAAGVMADIDALRDALVAVGDGSRKMVPATGSADELAELVAATNATIMKLDRSEVARRDLIAAVSHDLRTPITSLRLLAEAVDDDIVDGPTRRRYLAQMSTHLRGLSSLIDDLFELSRLEAGELEWSLQQVRVEEIVAETVEAMRVQAAQKGVRVDAHVSPTGMVEGHPEKLQRVLFNLIQNAIHHTPADGAVTVHAEMAKDRVEIEVCDTGPGIAPHDRPLVFDPFFRGGTDAARTRAGAGLGLAIARAIVEAHGGRIWLVDCELGTRVRFSLPSLARSAERAQPAGVAG